MPRPPNSNVQTPGTLSPQAPIEASSKLPDPVNVGAQNTVETPPADPETVTVSMAEFRALIEGQKAMQEQMAQMQAAQRLTAAAAVVEQQVARPTVAEAMADKPNVPVLTTEGWLVPESKAWIVSAKKD